MDRPPRYTLPRSARIRTKVDFDRVFRGGVRVSDRWMTLLAAPRDGTAVRLGISVSRRYGKAVHRNRIKRLIREAFRVLRPSLPAGTDWVAIPRPGVQADPAQIEDSMRLLSEQLGRRVKAP